MSCAKTSVITISLAFVVALSLGGCSSAIYTGAAQNSTTQDSKVSSENYGTSSQTIQSAGNSPTSNAINSVKKVRATIKIDPTAESTINLQTFEDPLHGWVVNGHEILATTDGGKMWDKISTVSGEVKDIGFVSIKHGWLFTGDSLQITDDGGRTWHDETIPQASGITLEQAQFIDDNHGWVMGTGEGAFIPDPKNPGSGQIPSIMVFWSTTNGGKTWTRINVPTQIANNEFQGRCYFSFFSPEQGFLLMGTQPGTGIQGKSLYRTADGGRHWIKATSIGFSASEPKHGLPGQGYISGLDFWNASVGWLSEERGPIYITTDGGKTWHPLLSLPPLRNMSDVHFLDSKHGYAIYRNVLFATEDGGTTWRQVYPSRMAHHVHVKPVL